MKTITTLLIIIITLVTTANAANTPANLEITSTTLVAGTLLSAGNNNNTLVINWTARNEASQSRYEIERSFYSNNFNTIATLQIPFSNNNSIKNFRISDDAAALTGRIIVYYRVKQVAANGNVTYSNVTVVNLQDAKNNSNLTVTNKTNASIRFSASQNGNAVIRIQGVTGKTVATQQATISKGINTLQLENLDTVKKGIYLTEVVVNGIVIDNQKIIID